MVWDAIRIMKDPISYELTVILMAKGTLGKCCSPKSFPSFKASLELQEINFNRIMHAHMLQKLSRLLFSPAHTSSLDCLIAGYVAYWARVRFLWSVSRSWSASCNFKRRTFAAHTSNMEFSSKSKHSKPVLLCTTSYSRTYCSAWWIHRMLISDNNLYISSFICRYTSSFCIKFHLVPMMPSWCSIFTNNSIYHFYYPVNKWHWLVIFFH